MRYLASEFSSPGSEGSATSNGIAEISEGLRKLGLNEGRDDVFEKRFDAGDYRRFPALAAALAQAGAGIVLSNTIAAARAAQALSPPLPVVLVAINDPVGTGLIASLARPGGHTTGVATLIEDLTPKMLEYQPMVVPGAKVPGIISNPGNPSNPVMVDNFRAHASAMGMKVRSVSLSLRYRRHICIPRGCQTRCASPDRRCCQRRSWRPTLPHSPLQSVFRSFQPNRPWSGSGACWPMALPAGCTRSEWVLT